MHYDLFEVVLLVLQLDLPLDLVLLSGLPQVVVRDDRLEGFLGKEAPLDVQEVFVL